MGTGAMTTGAFAGMRNLIRARERERQEAIDPLAMTVLQGASRMRAEKAANTEAEKQAVKRSNQKIQVNVDPMTGETTIDAKGVPFENGQMAVQNAHANEMQNLENLISARSKTLAVKDPYADLSGMTDRAISRELGGSFLKSWIDQVRVGTTVPREEAERQLRAHRLQEFNRANIQTSGALSDVQQPEKDDAAAAKLAKKEREQAIRNARILINQTDVSAYENPEAAFTDIMELSGAGSLDLGTDALDAIRRRVQAKHTQEQEKKAKEWESSFNALRAQNKAGFSSIDEVVDLAASMKGSELSDEEKKILVADTKQEMEVAERARRRAEGSTTQKPVKLTAGEGNALSVEDLLTYVGDSTVDQPTLRRRVQVRLNRMETDAQQLQDRLAEIEAEVQKKVTQYQAQGMTAEEIKQLVGPEAAQFNATEAELARLQASRRQLMGGIPTAWQRGR